MIIHINGVSASGKSTLGRKIAKNKKFLVIDTDDINDKNAMKIINDKKNNKLFTPKNMDKYFKLLDEMNNKDVKKILEKNKNKIIVFVGLTVKIPKTKHKYSIKVDYEENYRRLLKRTMDSFCKNSKTITKLLKSKNSIDKIAMILLHKYEIRMPIPENPPDIYQRIEKWDKRAKNEKYKILLPDKIYDEVIKL
jgi:adenylate kinase family enzyme